MAKWKSDIFDVIPKPMRLVIVILYILGAVEVMIGLGYTFYIAWKDLEFTDFKTEVLWSYALGMGAIGLALVVMAGTVFFVNIDRNGQGLSTYSPSKYGKAEGGGFLLNQGVNLLYLGLGVYLIYLSVFLVTL